MTRALVTGGAGFIGSHIVNLLLREGWDVVVLDDLSTGRRERVPDGVRFVPGSVTDADAAREALDGADYLFHTAALPRIQPSFDDPIAHEQVNVVGTLTCLEAAEGANLKKVVISSSASCYGNARVLPTPEDAPIDLLNPYALQKYAAEQYALILGARNAIPVVSLRYFNVYGPGSYNPDDRNNAYSSVVGVFAHLRKTGQPLTITGDGEQTRDYVHAADVARANLRAALSDAAGRVYNVAYGQPASVTRIADLVGGPRAYVPERKGEARDAWGDIARIRRELGWEPQVDLEAGLKTLL